MRVLNVLLLLVGVAQGCYPEQYTLSWGGDLQTTGNQALVVNGKHNTAAVADSGTVDYQTTTTIPYEGWLANVVCTTEHGGASFNVTTTSSPVTRVLVTCGQPAPALHFNAFDSLRVVWWPGSTFPGQSVVTLFIQYELAEKGRLTWTLPVGNQLANTYTTQYLSVNGVPSVASGDAEADHFGTMPVTYSRYVSFGTSAGDYSTGLFLWGNLLPDYLNRYPFFLDSSGVGSQIIQINFQDAPNVMRLGYAGYGSNPANFVSTIFFEGPAPESPSPFWSSFNYYFGASWASSEERQYLAVNGQRSSSPELGSAPYRANYMVPLDSYVDRLQWTTDAFPSGNFTIDLMTSGNAVASVNVLGSDGVFTFSPPFGPVYAGTFVNVSAAPNTPAVAGVVVAVVFRFQHFE